MKTLTISVADDLYQRASQKAATAETSLPEVVKGFLSEWTHEDLGSENVGSVRVAAESQRRTAFLKFLDDLATRPLKPGPSVGPLNREELHQRGVSGH
jgi:hypothetical protein